MMNSIKDLSYEDLEIVYNHVKHARKMRKIIRVTYLFIRDFHLKKSSPTMNGRKFSTLCKFYYMNLFNGHSHFWLENLFSLYRREMYELLKRELSHEGTLILDLDWVYLLDEWVDITQKEWSLTTAFTITEEDERVLERYKDYFLGWLSYALKVLPRGGEAYIFFRRALEEWL